MTKQKTNQSHSGTGDNTGRDKISIKTQINNKNTVFVINGILDRELSVKDADMPGFIKELAGYDLENIYESLSSACQNKELQEFRSKIKAEVHLRNRKKKYGELLISILFLSSIIFPLMIHLRQTEVKYVTIVPLSAALSLLTIIGSPFVLEFIKFYNQGMKGFFSTDHQKSEDNIKTAEFNIKEIEKELNEVETQQELVKKQIALQKAKESLEKLRKEANDNFEAQEKFSVMK